MNTETWNPGHALNKGYPFARNESKSHLPNRVNLFLEKDNVITMDLNDFADPGSDSHSQIEFLMSRLFDTQEALKIAEEQVEELLEDEPFIPEDLGFELVHKPETMHESPVRLYSSKYDDRFSLYRAFVDVYSDNINSAKWSVMKKDDDSDKFTKIDVFIPCMRIAYALFSALGVKMEPEKSEIVK